VVGTQPKRPVTNEAANFDRYIHRSIHDPKFNRQMALAHIRLVPIQEQFMKSVDPHAYVRLPPKTPKCRKNLRKTNKNLFQVDEGFEIVESDAEGDKEILESDAEVDNGGIGEQHQG
jgi:hypothetical protein